MATLPQRVTNGNWWISDMEKAAKAAFGYYIALHKNAGLTEAVAAQRHPF
jgi:hypothetical protein